tara:strand:+ start:2534 stop:2758 length:225 start_codon:yes stop_codon:yes gene_type:complete
MDNIFNTVGNFISKVTTLLMAMLSLGVMAEILYGKAVMGMSVIDNVMSIISKFGENGVIGLIAMIILYQLLEKK